MAGMVVGDVVVNLGENVDGGTRCHHQENQDHDGNARHFEVKKDFHVGFWTQRNTMGSLFFEKKTANEHESCVFIVVCQTR